MPVTIAESDSFPSTLTAPAANEPASAPALVSQFFQGIANSRRWLYNRLLPFVAGGAVAPADNLTITTATGDTVTVNGVVHYSPANGGGAAVLGSNGLTVDHDANVYGTVTAAKGWVPRRILVESADAGRTLTVATVDAYVLPVSGVWSATRTAILSRTGAISGVSEIEVINYDTVHSIDVSDNGVGTIVTVLAASPGVPTKKRFLFLAGAWVIS